VSACDCSAVAIRSYKTIGLLPAAMKLPFLGARAIGLDADTEVLEFARVKADSTGLVLICIQK
jgi:DNA-binding transcriptional MerR regulator